MIKCSFAMVCNEVINMINKIPFLSAEQKNQKAQYRTSHLVCGKY